MTGEMMTGDGEMMTGDGDNVIAHASAKAPASKCRGQSAKQQETWFRKTPGR